MRKLVASQPIYANGRIVGWIETYSDGTSAFKQAKRVIAGHCVNYGPQWHRG